MQKVHFKTNILLKNIIGKDLITDDNIAVLELVKNSYDAGSPCVDLDFRSLSLDNQINKDDEKTSSLIISDKGIGMDYDGLINRWLNIAYSEKKDNTWLNGRRQAGNKGVGRFSCDRLGKFLTIYTKKEGQACLSLFIDWSKFEDESAINNEIQDVKLVLKEVSVQEVLDITGWLDFQHGTVLQISELRERWNINKLLRLKRDLEKFISPNQAFQNINFTINIKALEFLAYDNQKSKDIEKINGEVKNQIFDRLNFKTSSIVSYIDKDGEYIYTTLVDRGRNVFELKERNIYSHLRNVKTYIYYLNTYSKRYFTIQTGFSSVDFGSIFLFVNGFRVPPYGDQGDDWLGIEKRKSLGYKRYLSTREIVGRIEITDENDDFKIITSRSGIVHNNAFEELSREGAPYGFFYRAFRRLERFVVEGINWDKTGNNISNETKEKESFLLDDFSRNKQILSIIRKIIDSNDNDIIELNINNNLVKDILDKQIEKTHISLDNIINNLSEIMDTMDVEGIHKYQSKLFEDKKELERLINVVNKLSPDSNKLLEIQVIKNLVEEKQKEFKKLETELLRTKYEKEKAEAESYRLAQELAIEKEKNTYLLTSARNMSEDAKNMIHNIKIISTDIKSESEVLFDILSNDHLSVKNALESVSLIKFLNEKALKISKLITRANFKSESDEQIVNIVEYLKQYINIYKDIVEKCNLNIQYKTNCESFERIISVLDLALIVDNLVSNSQKAHASFIKFEIFKLNQNQIEIEISDNGTGLDESLHFNPDKIFELGVTTTDGSGIGLYAVRTSLRKIGCDINYKGTNPNGTGAIFSILINK